MTVSTYKGLRVKFTPMGNTVIFALLISQVMGWVDSTPDGSLFHGHCTLYKFNLFIIIQHYYLSLYLENQRILIVGTFYPLAVLGI